MLIYEMLVGVPPFYDETATVSAPTIPFNPE